jgi:hypothetical protein
MLPVTKRELLTIKEKEVQSESSLLWPSSCHDQKSRKLFVS